MAHKSPRLGAAVPDDAAPLIKQEFNNGWAGEASSMNYHQYYETQNDIDGAQHDDEDARHDYKDTQHAHEDTRYAHEDTRRAHEDTRYAHEDTRHKDTQHTYKDTRHAYKDTQHDYENTRHAYEDTRHAYEDTQHAYEDTQHDYEDTQHDYEDTEQDYKDARHAYEDTRQDYNRTQHDYTDTEQYDGTRQHAPDTNDYHDEHRDGSIEEDNDVLSNDGDFSRSMWWSAEEDASLNKLRKQYVLITDIAKRSPRKGMSSTAKRIARLGGTFDLSNSDDMIGFYRDHLLTLGVRQLRPLFLRWMKAIGRKYRKFVYDGQFFFVLAAFSC